MIPKARNARHGCDHWADGLRLVLMAGERNALQESPIA